eukprot:gene3274-6482_t
MTMVWGGLWELPSRISPKILGVGMNEKNYTNWADLLVTLCSGRGSEKCSLRLLDTVVVDESKPNSPHWYYTTKSGAIAKKKDNSSAINSICDRFSRFALANPANVEKFIATIVKVDSSRNQLTLSELNSYFNIVEQQSEDCFIQVYLRPRRGIHEIFVGTYDDATKADGDGLMVTIRTDNDETVITDDQLSIRKQIMEYMQEVIKFMRNFKHKEVVTAVGEFILDDNEHIWLSNISQLILADESSPSSSSSLVVVEESPPMAMEEPQPIPKNTLRSREASRQGAADRKSSSGDGSTTSGGGSGLQRIGSATSAVPVGGNGSREASESIGRGELIFREGKTILSALGPEELPGLRAWTPVSFTPGGKCVWGVDMDEYALHPQPDEDAAGLRRERAETRHLIPQASLSLRLLLLRGTEELLLGRVSFPDEGAFTERWRQLHTTVLNTPLDAARSSADVAVCGNCLAVVWKLDNLAAAGFRAVSVPVSDNSYNPKHKHKLNLDNKAKEKTTASASVSARNGNGNGTERPRSDSRVGKVASLEKQQQGRHVSSAGNNNIRDLPSEMEGASIGGMGMGVVGIPPLSDWDYDITSDTRGSTRSSARSGTRSATHQPRTGKEESTETEEGTGEGLSPQDVTDENLSHHQDTPEAHQYSSTKKATQKGAHRPLPTGGGGGGGKRIQEASSAYGIGTDSHPNTNTNASGRKGKQGKGKKSVVTQSESESANAIVRLMAKAASRDQISRLQEDRNKVSSPAYVSSATEEGSSPSPRHSVPHVAQKSQKKIHTIINNRKIKKDSLVAAARKPAGLQEGSMSSLSNPMAEGFGYGFDVQAWSVAPTTMTDYFIPADRSIMSASETQFMLRHADSGQMLGLELGLSPDGLGDDGHGHGHDHNTKTDIAIIGAMNGKGNNRTELLEKQLEAVQKKLRRKEEELEGLEETSKRRIRELDGQRQAALDDAKRTQDRHEKAMISLREEHARELAAATASSSSGVHSPTTNVVSHDNRESNRHMLEQLDMARTELRRQQDVFAAERRQMQTDFASRLESRDRQARSDAAALRSQVGGLEDRLSSVNDELAASIAKSDGLLKMCKQLEQTRQEAVETCNKLRTDLRGMQQAVTSSYRLEASQGMSVGPDPEAVLRMSEARLGAKEKQLDNKIEFMKAQLAAEQAACEELRGALQTSQSRQEDIKEEFRLRLREAEMSKQQAVEDTERRLELQFEGRISELTVLQAKVALLQGQLQDAFQDGAMSKQREEGAKASLSKALAQASAMRAENENYRQQIEEFRDQREQSTVREASKQNQDAVLRRLDNERQYLKSQLATEMAHKNDLQKELNQCQSVLSDTQRQWRADVEQLREVAAANTVEAARHELTLQEANIQLDAEAVRLRATTKELKEGYTKTRDLLRLEQLALETVRAEIALVNDELLASREESLRLKLVEENMNVMHKGEVEALVKSMEETEDRWRHEVVRVKEELSKQFLLQSSLQQDSLQQRNVIDRERQIATRHMGTVQIVDAVRRWRRGRLFSFFRQWLGTTGLISAAEQFRETLQRALKTASEEAKNERQYALEALRGVLRSEHEVQIAEIRTEAESARIMALEEAQRHEAEAIATREDELESNFSLKEIEWDRELQEMRRLGEAAAQQERVMGQLKVEETVVRCNADLEAAAQDTILQVQRARAEVAQKLEEVWSSRLRAREVELDFQSSKDLKVLQDRHKADLEEISRDHLRRLTEKDELRNEQLRNAYEEWLQTKDVEIDALRKSMDMDNEANIKKATEEHERNITDFRQQLFEETEDRIRELRKLWDEEAKEERDKLEKDIEDRIQMRLVDTQKAAETERLRSLKLEAQKWQQAAKESQRRFELDLNVARSQGWEERDVAAAAETEQLQASHTLSRTQMVDKHRAELDELVKNHSASMDHLKNVMEAEREEVCRHTEQQTAAAKDLEWTETLRKKLSQCEEEMRTLWEGRLRKEQERLEKFREDATRQSQHHAQERQELLERISRHEDMSKRMEALGNAEVEQVKRDCETEKDKLKQRLEKVKEKALAELRETMTADKEAAEGRWKEETDRMIRREREAVQLDTESQLSQLQEESEKLVSGLETALNDLRNEKRALSAELESAASKLEEVEDAQYDSQQVLKKAKVAHSFQIWQLCTASMRLKFRFTTTLKAVRDEGDEQLAKCVETSEHREEELETASCRMVALVAQADAARKKIQGVLASYKTEVLMEKRTQIRLCEREMSRLGEERDTLEGQRERMEDEVRDLQTQVQDIEEQIRDHNRSSAVQNGRINVAHARKKRRLDGELERIFDLIEQKREQLTELEERIAERSRERDEKESELVDAEKVLVQILIEQQRLVLTHVEDAQVIDESVHLVLRIGAITVPVSDTGPSVPEVAALRIEAKDTDMRRKAARL